jgi:N-acetylneuraminic acid mutarotase
LYDPVSGTWSTAAPMFRSRYRHRAVPLPNGRVLVVGGVNAASSAEIYDPVSNRWTPASRPATPRYEGFALTSLRDGRVLLAGGFINNRGDATNAAEVFDPANNMWRTAAPLPGPPRLGHSATVLANGLVLVTGGQTASHPSRFLKDTWLYDPVANAWHDGAPLLIARASHAALLLSVSHAVALFSCAVHR